MYKSYVYKSLPDQKNLEDKLKEARTEKFKDKFNDEVTIWQPPIGSF